MIRKTKEWFNWVSNIGVTDEITYVEKLRIQIFNQASVFICVGLWLGEIESVLDDENKSLYVLCFSLFPLFGIVLNHFGHYLFSKIFMTTIISFIIFIFVLLLGTESGGQYSFFAYALAALIGFDDKRISFSVAFYNTLLFIAVTWLFSFLESPWNHNIDEKDELINLSITLFIFSWVLYSFLSGLKIQEAELNKQKEKLHLNNQQLTELVEKNNLKLELLSILAHDIRRPVESFKHLSSKINFLIRKNETERLMELGHFYEESAEKLFHNIQNLLHWVISQKENLDIKITAFNFMQTVDQILNDLYYLKRQKEITILNKIPPSQSIVTDENILRIIVRNVIHNAIKFSRNKGRIIIDLEIKKDEYEIIISDSGIGMSTTLIEQINNDALENRVGQNGYGLGLGICIFLINSIHGKILIDSEEGHGTIIKLILPASTLNQVLKNDASKSSIVPASSDSNSFN